MLVLLTGCSAVPVQFDTQSHQAPDTATIFVYRPDAMTHILVTTDVKVDGTQQFSLKNNRYQVLHLAPGVHHFSMQLNERYQGAHEIDLQTTAGQSYFLRIDTAMAFRQNQPYDRRFDIRPVNEAEALPQLAGCKPAAADTRTVAEPVTEKSPGYSSQTFRNPFSR